MFAPCSLGKGVMRMVTYEQLIDLLGLLLRIVEITILVVCVKNKK